MRRTTPPGPTRAQQLGLDAERLARQTLVTEITQTLTPPSPLPGDMGPLSPDQERRQQNYNSFRLLVIDHARRYPTGPNAFQRSDALEQLLTPGGRLNEGQIQQIADEMANHGTLFGVPTSQVEYRDENNQAVSATSLFRLNAPRLIGQSVAENTGNLGFLGGATFGQALRGFFSWLMSGFSGGMQGLWDSIGQTTATDTTTALRPRLQREGYDTPTIDRMVNEVNDNIMRRANPNYRPPADRAPMPPITVSQRDTAGLRQRVESAIRPLVTRALTPPERELGLPGSLDDFRRMMPATGGSLLAAGLTPESRQVMQEMLVTQLTEATMNNETPEEIRARLQRALTNTDPARGPTREQLGMTGMEQDNIAVFTRMVTEQYTAAMNEVMPRGQTPDPQIIPPSAGLFRGGQGSRPHAR